MLDPNDLVGVVKEDLQYLIDSWEKPISTAELRRASPTLRRLLCDGELQRAWKAMGYQRQPSIVCGDLEEVLGDGDRTSIFVATADPYRQPDFMVGGFLLWRNRDPDDAMSNRLHANAEHPVTLPLNRFVAAPAVCTGGKIISRHTVIKYVTNKLGGGHHDAQRGLDQFELDCATLDRLARDERFHFQNYPMVHYTLLAIGQAVANSPDIRRMVSGEGPQLGP